MKKRLLAALLAGAMALTMTACGGSSSGSDDSNAASGSDSGSAGSYKVGIVQLVQHEALDAATQGFQDKLKELVEADGGEVKFERLRRVRKLHHHRKRLCFRGCGPHYGERYHGSAGCTGRHL